MDRMRSQEVTANVSAVSKIPRVREIMVIKQRELAQYKNVVAEGRDMATVVFPDAQLKIYLDASVEERVNRRWRELAAKGIDVSKMQLKTEIVNRDRIDSSREHSPLKRAKDAVFIDTTAMTVTEQVEMIYKQFKNMSKKQ